MVNCKIDQKRGCPCGYAYMYVYVYVCVRGGIKYVLTRTYGRLVTARSSKAYTVEI